MAVKMLRTSYLEIKRPLKDNTYIITVYLLNSSLSGAFCAVKLACSAIGIAALFWAPTYNQSSCRFHWLSVGDRS